MSKEPSPGPWEWFRSTDYDTFRIVSGTLSIAYVSAQTGHGEANTRLMVAAPDLLEACKAVQSILWMAKEYADAGGSHGPEMRDYKEAESLLEAALAKARGEEGEAGG